MTHPPETPDPASELSIRASAALLGVDDLRTQALRCRRLAQAVNDQEAVDALLAIAHEYEVHADAPGPGPRPA